MVAIMRPGARIRRGGLGLDACLSQNRQHAREHNLTIPWNCFYTPPPYEPSTNPVTNVGVEASKETEGDLQTPSNATINGTTTANGSSHVSNNKNLVIPVVVAVAVVFSFGIFFIFAARWRSKKKERLSSQTSKYATDGGSDGGSNLLDSKQVENSRWVSKMFRKESQISNDSAIELGNKVPIRNKEAAPELCTPSSRFDSCTTLNTEASTQASQYSVRRGVQPVEGVDITNLRTPQYFFPMDPSRQNALPTREEMRITDEPSNHPTTQPNLAVTIPIRNTEARNQQSFPGKKQSCELDISQLSTLFDHNAPDDSDDEDATIGRLSISPTGHEMLASVVTLQRQKAQKVESRPRSSKSSTKSVPRSEASPSNVKVETSSSSVTEQSTRSASPPLTGMYGVNGDAYIGSSLSVGSKRESRFTEDLGARESEGVL